MEAPGERTLVISSLRGDAEAFGQLVERYQQQVFNVCYRMLEEHREAEDLTQETFLRVFQRLESFDIERPFGPWIRRVAVNLCLNHIQAQNPEGVSLDEEQHQQNTAGGESLGLRLPNNDDRWDVREAILELPAKYRAVIELRHYQDMSYQEISSELEIPVSDVKSYLFRARKQLSKRIKVDER